MGIYCPHCRFYWNDVGRNGTFSLRLPPNCGGISSLQPLCDHVSDLPVTRVIHVYAINEGPALEFGGIEIQKWDSDFGASLRQLGRVLWPDFGDSVSLGHPVLSPLRIQAVEFLLLHGEAAKFWVCEGLQAEQNPIVILKRSGQDGDIDISLSPESRGLGYGARVIELGVASASAERDGGRLHAFVKPENQASRRAFESAGFKKSGEEHVGGHATVHYVFVMRQNHR